MQGLPALLCMCVVLLWGGLAMAEDPVQGPCLNKAARTAAQKKIASALLCEMYPAGNAHKVSPIQKDDEGRVLVDIRTRDLASTGARIAELGGKVTYRSERYHAIHAYLPLKGLEDLAEMAEVRAIQPVAVATTNPR